MSLLNVSGRFYRAMHPDAVARVLDSPGPESAGRYHRPGQPALYVTREADWAVIAIQRYAATESAPRLVVPLRIDAAAVVDQRDPVQCAALGIYADDAAARWQQWLARDEEPPSWRNADAARAVGADGIVDPSRGIVDGWHLALFHWNQPGAPQVIVDGEPMVIRYAEARTRWASPNGWIEAHGDETY
jgi:RES domain-containing protein